MKKKTIAIVLTVAIVVIAAIGATYAYFTANKTDNGTFTVGSVDITLNNATLTATNIYPSEAFTNMKPSISNTGKNDAYVRLQVTVSDAAAWKKACADNGISDLSTIFTGFKSSDWTRTGISEDTSKDTITYTYLYKSVLAHSTDTSTLFDSIIIPSSFNNKEFTAIGDFNITVIAQATQKDGFSDAASAFAATFDKP